jgi:hypothetical protein
MKNWLKLKDQEDLEKVQLEKYTKRKAEGGLFINDSK